MDYSSFQPGGQNLQTPPSPVPEIPKPQNLSDKLRPYRWHIAISGVIIIAILFGAYSYIKYTNEKLSQEIGPTFTPRADVTAGWQTYTNAQYGFGFKYPTGWTFQDVGDNNIGFFPSGKSIDLKNEYVGNIVLTVLSNPKQLNLKTFYGQNPDGDLFKQSEKQILMTIDQHESEKFIGISGMIPSDTVSINKDKAIIELTDVGQLDITDGVFNQILSTFKFTNSNLPAGSGVLSGHVDIGPNCPVEQVGVTCTPSPEAYTSRSVSIYKADGTTLVATQSFDADGNYHIVLPAETYVVKSQTYISSTLNAVGTVTIQSGQTAILNFNIDTGIR